jgi:hypothetical protein
MCAIICGVERSRFTVSTRNGVCAPGAPRSFSCQAVGRPASSVVAETWDIVRACAGQVGRVSVFLVSGDRLLVAAAPGVAASLGGQRIDGLAVAIFTLASLAAGLSRFTAVRPVSLGYYVTGQLFVNRQALEAWLMNWDLRRSAITTRFAHWPDWLVAYRSGIYCLFLLLRPGSPRSSWQARGGAYRRCGAAALGPSAAQFFRPDRLGARPTRGSAATLPSAGTVSGKFSDSRAYSSGLTSHVAVSLAIALAVMGSMPATGAALLALAVSVSLACVVGRYHYVIDVVAGALLALAVSIAVQVFGI